MPSINSFVNLGENQEWSVVNMESNVQLMFDKMKAQYFGVWLKSTSYTIKWDRNHVILDGSSYRVFESHKEVLITLEAVTRPRIQLVSVLFHILIHLYLNVASKGAVKLNNHNDDFRALMLFLNETLKTEVNTCHKLTNEPNEDMNKHWWQCTGVCSAYEPFHGVIRSQTKPNEAMAFYSAHEEKCSGVFFKIMEMTRTNQETEELEKKYVRNVHYIEPQPRSGQTTQHSHLKTTIQVRELFDLTDDNETAPHVQNLCDVIDLDESQYVDSSTTAETSEVVRQFTSQRPPVFQKCPFCETIIGCMRFMEHVDKCRGFQQKVQYRIK